MLDITEINNTIEELENGNTTFDVCLKLASLYCVRDKMMSYNTVVEEYHDILPEYSHYCNLKRKFQLGEINQQCVLESLSCVCIEINEFIKTLYNSVDIIEEREILNTKLSLGSGE